jgi:NADPH:quinone reductase
MKAWVVTELGQPDQMIWTELEEPKPSPGQVAIEVAASGRNFLDALIIAGRYQVNPSLPFVQGAEVSGTVIALGKNSEFARGERACATLQVFGFARVPVADRLETERVPAEMSFMEAVAVRVVYPTAYAALRLRADVKSGETILVHAGAVGTGVVAIQIAKSFACRVIATAGSERKLRICTEQGADGGFDYSTARWLEAVKRETGKRGVDVVSDPVGGSITEESVRCLAWNGRRVIVGLRAQRDRVDSHQLAAFGQCERHRRLFGRLMRRTIQTDPSLSSRRYSACGARERSRRSYPRFSNPRCACRDRK